MGKKKNKQRHMLAPIWLDTPDQKAVDELTEFLWARTKQDAFLQSLRWVCLHIAKHPNAHRRFRRESDRAFADGKALVLRVTDEQREYLENLQEEIRAESLTDAVRIVIRMALDHFTSQ